MLKSFSYALCMVVLLSSRVMAMEPSVFVVNNTNNEITITGATNAPTTLKERPNFSKVIAVGNKVEIPSPGYLTKLDILDHVVETRWLRPSIISPITTPVLDEVKPILANELKVAQQTDEDIMIIISASSIGKYRFGFQRIPREKEKAEKLVREARYTSLDQFFPVVEMAKAQHKQVLPYYYLGLSPYATPNTVDSAYELIRTHFDRLIANAPHNMLYKEALKELDDAYGAIKTNPSTLPLSGVFYHYFPMVNLAYMSDMPILPRYFLNLNEDASGLEIEEAYRQEHQKLQSFLEITTPETHAVYEEALQALNKAYQYLKFINDTMVERSEFNPLPVLKVSAATPTSAATPEPK